MNPPRSFVDASAAQTAPPRRQLLVLAARLVRPSRIDLVGNVRSPRTLAAVVQHAGRLYRRVPKEERPRGQGETDLDDAVEGRVLRCRVKDDAELARVMGLLREVPSTAVVCPGWRAPADVVDAHGEIFTSERAKGLEFRIVAVLGAGPHLRLLREWTAKGEVCALEATLARTMIDQLRVALSRPTDTLILLDRAGDPGDALVEQLCLDAKGQPLDGWLGEVSADDLAVLLSRDDATAEEQVHEILQDVRASMARAPLRALDQMRHARGLLGRAAMRAKSQSCGSASAQNTSPSVGSSLSPPHPASSTARTPARRTAARTSAVTAAGSWFAMLPNPMLTTGPPRDTKSSSAAGGRHPSRAGSDQ